MSPALNETYCKNANKFYCTMYILILSQPILLLLLLLIETIQDSSEKYQINEKKGDLLELFILIIISLLDPIVYISLLFVYIKGLDKF